MRTLYFDIDGTVLVIDQAKVKPALRNGAFERAVRQAGFERLVCVGNFGAVAHTVKAMGFPYDELGILLDICHDAIVDDQWFREVTSLIANPERRVDEIDYAGDWWYVDDLAAYYFKNSQYEGVLEANRGDRVLIPDPRGGGMDILRWLRYAATRH